MGGIVEHMPMVYACVLIGSLSLMALPYMSGYYSKDMILEVSNSQYRVNGRVTNWLGLVTATITSLYTMRMISCIFFNSPNGKWKVFGEKEIEKKIFICEIELVNGPGTWKVYGRVIERKVLLFEIPLVILAIGSIVLGYMTKEVFVGVGSTFMSSMFVHPSNTIGIEREEIQGYVKLLPVIATLMGGVLYRVLREGRTVVWIRGIGMYRGRLMNMVVGRTGRGFDWWDKIYNATVISGGSDVAKEMAKKIDKGVLESIGPLGLKRTFMGLSRGMADLDSGYIPHYGLYIILGVLVVLGMGMIGG